MALTSEQIDYLLAGAIKPKATQGKHFNLKSEAEHLLSLNFVNLFEPYPIFQEWIFRCKGCDEILKRTKREEHFMSHKSSQ